MSWERLLAAFLGWMLVMLLKGGIASASIESWVGTWAGSCRLIPAFQGAESMTIRLTVGKQQAGTRREGLKGPFFPWIIQYEGQAPRNYRMIRVGEGRWVLDEANGILIDVVEAGTRFDSLFQVGDRLLHSRDEWVSPYKIRFEIEAFNTKGVRQSGGDLKLGVLSYQQVSTQQCELDRIDAK